MRAKFHQPIPSAFHEGHVCIMTVMWQSSVPCQEVPYSTPPAGMLSVPCLAVAGEGCVLSRPNTHHTAHHLVELLARVTTDPWDTHYNYYYCYDIAVTAEQATWILPDSTLGIVSCTFIWLGGVLLISIGQQTIQHWEEIILDLYIGIKQ